MADIQDELLICAELKKWGLSEEQIAHTENRMSDGSGLILFNEPVTVNGTLIKGFLAYSPFGLRLMIANQITYTPHFEKGAQSSIEVMEMYAKMAGQELTERDYRWCKLADDLNFFLIFFHSKDKLRIARELLKRGAQLAPYVFAWRDLVKVGGIFIQSVYNQGGHYETALHRKVFGEECGDVCPVDMFED